MPIDPNIIFKQKTIGDFMNENDLMNMKRAELDQKGAGDLGKLAENSFWTKIMGGKLSPEQDRLAQAYDIMKQKEQIDAEGNKYITPSVLDRLGSPASYSQTAPSPYGRIDEFKQSEAPLTNDFGVAPMNLTQMTQAVSNEPISPYQNESAGPPVPGTIKNDPIYQNLQAKIGQTNALKTPSEIGVTDNAKTRGMINDLTIKNAFEKPPAIAEFDTVKNMDPETRKQYEDFQAAKKAKPLPSSIMKLKNETIDMIQNNASISADIKQMRKAIQDGNLNFGLGKNIDASARNYFGASTPESRNFATFKTSLEKLRNDSLKLNKGVQTEGDAQRAMNELLSNLNDPALIDQRLGELDAINERAAQLRQMQVDEVDQTYNQPATDMAKFTNVKPAIMLNNSKKPSSIKYLGTE